MTKSDETGTIVAASSLGAGRNSAGSSGLWRRLTGMSLRSKLLLMLLPAGMLSMGIAALLGFLAAREALTKQAIEQMTTVRAAKKAQVETYFSTLRNTFGVFSDDVAMIAAANLFVDGFNQLGKTKLAPERRQKLEDYYKTTFVPELNKTPGFEAMTPSNLWPRTDRSLEAQTLFIAENPYKPKDRLKLIDHPVSNPYTLAHFTYHPWLSDVATRLKLYDLMLVDAGSGNVVYSLAKEPDFASNLIDGPYSTTNLGRLFRQVVGEHRKGYIKMTDLEFYAPSNGAPAMFIATPIYSSFKLVGVLIGQLSIDEINKAMNGDKTWKTDGLGETGFAVVVGRDMMMRTDVRGFIENKDQYLQRAAAQGAAPASIEAMRRHGTTVLNRQVNNEALHKALLGEKGVTIGRNSLGVSTMQAYGPLDIPDLNWALTAQIAEKEVLAPLENLKRSTIIVACLLTLLTTLLSMLMASRFLKPIEALVDGIEAIKAGKTDIRIKPQSSDEIGKLTESFNDMSAVIQQRDATIQAKNAAYATLLQRIFPDVVAERLRIGDVQIVDTMPNISLIYASIVGFSQETDHFDGKTSSALLNELIDSLDAIADEHGIDRVRSFGEHYIAACGLSVPRLDHAQRSVDFVDAVANEVRAIAARRGIKLSVRASVASGKVNAGLVGNHRFVFDVWGRPLNQIRRLIHEAAIDEIRITEDTLALLRTDHGFETRPRVATLTLGSLASFGRSLSSAQVRTEQRPANGAGPLRASS